MALRSPAAVFTYCKSRGLFAGISLEGSCLIERKETNRKFYCQDIRAYDILFGDIPRPAQAEDLYEILDSFTEKFENEGRRIDARRAAREQRKATVVRLPFSRWPPGPPRGVPSLTPGPWAPTGRPLSVRSREVPVRCHAQGPGTSLSPWRPPSQEELRGPDA